MGQLGDNCIVFENFTASIGDLMVANIVWVNGYLRPLNRQLMPWNHVYISNLVFALHL
jgi:hypothetical protein